MATGFRAGLYGILGRIGPGEVVVVPPDESLGVISPDTGQSSFWFETTLLGRTIFPFAPPLWNTVNKTKVAASNQTWGSTVIEEWPVVTQGGGMIGVEATLKWQILSMEDFGTLRDYYESEQQVTWNPGARARVPDEIYYVTLTALKPEKGHRIHPYVENVELKINIRGVV